MSEALCLRCWRVTPPAELRYRCGLCEASSSLGSGPGASTRMGSWFDDPNASLARDDGELPRLGVDGGSRIARWFGDDDDAAEGRGCPHHPETRIEIVCECGASVEPRSQLLRQEPLGLGIAGPRSAGKTLLLLTMVHALNSDGARAMDLFAVGDTSRRFHELSSRFFDRGERPSPTPDMPREPTLRDNSQSYCWQLMPVDGKGRHALFAVHDVAGETWGQPSHVSLPTFDRYLDLVSSLIFVIDGAIVAADLGYPAADAWNRDRDRVGDRGAADEEWLGHLIDRLGDQSKRTDLAVVVTKGDLLWQEEEWRQLRESSDTTPGDATSDDATSDDATSDDAVVDKQRLLEELLERAYRRKLLTASRNFFRRVRLFAVSSLGFSPADADLDGDRLERKPKPLGVLEPLDWLLEQRGLGARRGRGR